MIFKLTRLELVFTCSPRHVKSFGQVQIIHEDHPPNRQAQFTFQQILFLQSITFLVPILMEKSYHFYITKSPTMLALATCNS